MSASKVLEKTLDEILSAIKPSREDQIARNQIIAELQTVVRSMDIFRGAIVEPFGSFVSGLFTRWGDLDISIELPNGSYISSTATEQKQLMLSFLQSRLIGRYQRLQFICTARVPIVKFESRSISCDVSIDNLSGQMKSKLLLWIKGIDEHFGDMVLLVKEWAKAQEINNSTSGSFNSYSLTLLVIFHFQTCVPAILPPLKDIYPGDIASDLKGVRADVVQRITETCTANIARWKSNRYRLVNQSSLSELLVSFFSKFGLCANFIPFDERGCREADTVVDKVFGVNERTSATGNLHRRKRYVEMRRSTYLAEDIKLVTVHRERKDNACNTTVDKAASTVHSSDSSHKAHAHKDAGRETDVDEQTKSCREDDIHESPFMERSGDSRENAGGTQRRKEAHLLWEAKGRGHESFSQAFSALVLWPSLAEITELELPELLIFRAAGH
ncbi:protein HESO1 [Eucalyptus grandis]|uniref:protein HESO1 n=1 Tax=Eucalyptus grandis TaxID=71139 RepID=UPI00192EF009|nr:protein HESO1 [Eucalyptus grandis]